MSDQQHSHQWLEDQGATFNQRMLINQARIRAEELVSAGSLEHQLTQSLGLANKARMQAEHRAVKAMEAACAAILFDHLAGARVISAAKQSFVVELATGEQLRVTPLDPDDKKGPLFTYFMQEGHDGPLRRASRNIVGMQINHGSCLYEDKQMRPTLLLTRPGDPISCAIYPPGDYERNGGKPGSFETKLIAPKA